jgi:hypothetical protein
MNAGPSKQFLQALRDGLQEANDQKIRQIVALLDRSPENQISQAVLDPIRPRLAALKPARALHFTRLLFLPFGDMIVSAPVWRPGQAAVPRTALNSVARTVRAQMNGETEVIDRMIVGHTTDDTNVVRHAGEALWGRAADILSLALPPADWGETGLRTTAFVPLMQGIVTVLRRAVPLWYLLQDAELGVLEPDELAVGKIISNLANEPPEGRAMVVRLILRRLPHAVSLLRRLADSVLGVADKALLQTAIDRGTDDILSDMESQADLTQDLRAGSLAAVGTEVQRIAGLLDEINHDPSGARHRPRVNGIRLKLDAACRERFTDGLRMGLVTPLAAATAPVDSAGQKQLENCARDLRTVETAGRRLGSVTNYDALLFKASEVVQAAADSGNLGSVRAIRLVEILSGSETAEAMYKRAVASTAKVRL